MVIKMGILLLLIVLLPLIAQIGVKSNYSKYTKQKNGLKMNGYEVATKILEMNNLAYVKVNKTGGLLSDHYNPANKTVNLSSEIYESNSIAAIAVAAHEVGHAIQDKELYQPMVLRSKLVPVVNFASRASSVILILGLILEIGGLIDLAILLLTVSLLFQLITLPVEFNASERAKEQLKKCGFIQDKDTKGVSKMLKAAAFTYVATFLASALQIVRLVMATRDR
jgi:Zn-dependent membrane protease YugP